MSKRKSLRDLLFFYLLTVSIVPLVIFASAVLLFVTSRVKTEVQEENRIIAQSISREVGSFLEQVDSVERWLVSSLTVNEAENPIAEASEIERLLEVTRDEFPFFESLQLLDGKGVVRYVAPDNEDQRGSSMVNQPYFHIPSKTGETYWSSTFTSSVSGDPTIAVSRSTDSGVLVGYINLRRLELYPEAPERLRRQSILITDHRGTVIAYPDRRLVQQRKNLYSHPVIKNAFAGRSNTYETSFQGEKVLCSASVIERTGWPVVVLQKRSEAYTMMRYVMWTSVGLVLLSSVLSVLLSYIGRKRVMTPLRRMNTVIESISSGEYGGSIPRKRSYPEMERIITSMEQMSREVEHREEALRKSEQKYRELVQNAASIIIRWNAEYRITFLNEYAEYYWNYSGEEAVGKSIAGNIMPAVTKDGTPLEETLDDLWRNPEKYRTTYFTHRTSGGGLVTIRWTNRPIIDEEGQVVEMLSVGTDVTDITEIRKKLEQSLREKEVLLREVHHRVKNNLQVILSMLNLKFGPLLEAEGERQLYDSMGHIYAIAQIHEQLYHTDDFTSVDFKEYLDQVVGYIMNVEEYRMLEVELHIDVAEVYLDLDRAIPAGLTVYELVTNSLAHAGFSRGEGRISIYGREKGESISLVVQDNGPGFDPSRLDSPSTFGFTLIAELMQQLKGTIEYQMDYGSRFEITFSTESRSAVSQNA